MKTTDEIYQEAMWRFTNGHGYTDTNSVETFIEACKWMSESMLKFDDQDRAMYYEDKIEMLIRINSKLFGGIELIALERQEQIEKHGRTTAHDVKENHNGQLIRGAISLLTEGYVYALPNEWDKNICEKMSAKSRKDKMVIAAALIAAEIDRLNALEV